MRITGSSCTCAPCNWMTGRKASDGLRSCDSSSRFKATWRNSDPQSARQPDLLCTSRYGSTGRLLCETAWRDHWKRRAAEIVLQQEVVEAAPVAEVSDRESGVQGCGGRSKGAVAGSFLAAEGEEADSGGPLPGTSCDYWGSEARVVRSDSGAAVAHQYHQHRHQQLRQQQHQPHQQSHLEAHQQPRQPHHEPHQQQHHQRAAVPGVEPNAVWTPPSHTREFPWLSSSPKAPPAAVDSPSARWEGGVGAEERVGYGAWRKRGTEAVAVRSGDALPGEHFEARRLQFSDDAAAAAPAAGLLGDLEASKDGSPTKRARAGLTRPLAAATTGEAAAAAAAVAAAAAAVYRGYQAPSCHVADKLQQLRCFDNRAQARQGTVALDAVEAMLVHARAALGAAAATGGVAGTNNANSLQGGMPGTPRAGRPLPSVDADECFAGRLDDAFQRQQHQQTAAALSHGMLRLLFDDGSLAASAAVNARAMAAAAAAAATAAGGGLGQVMVGGMGPASPALSESGRGDYRATRAGLFGNPYGGYIQ
ncbi:unnamed protein product [Closterium sp. NIES-65]|nr:unnamed protein product [Closterium sp. NIES-65]